ncbi:element excision factor XisI family protein [Fibrella aestuarina]|uniref:element excision factor XisI family protein n=1 Tax=Fibrella aestuarina TaxID=651143 RepID=UPI00059B6030|nr:element excision factor XisI family protein [Fibrella aestuarina]
MDSAQRIGHYAAIVSQYLAEHEDQEIEGESYRRVVIVDRDHHHYQLVATGWVTPSRFVDALLIHLQIKADGKTWLLENSTELHVAQDLADRGIAKEDIVLGFHPPQYRALTGYAIA